MRQKKLAPRPPSAAMAVALTALFVALGGTGYAASQIAPSDATAHAAAKGPRGPRGFQGPRGFPGPAGAKGATGPAGANGATNVVMRQGAAVVVSAGSFAKAEASCNAGERATGGGLYNEDQVFLPRITSSYPTPNPASPPPTGDGQVPTGWRVWVSNKDNASNITVYAYVICAAP
jgi:hypothetical protein